MKSRWTTPNPDTFADEVEALLTGSVAEAWSHCLPVWSKYGRVNDYPHGTRYPKYWPSFETRLGRCFVAKFTNELLFLLARYEQGTPAEQLCAFDLLCIFAEKCFARADALPAVLRDCPLPIIEPAKSEIAGACGFYLPDIVFDGLGMYLAFEANGEELPDANPADPE